MDASFSGPSSRLSIVIPTRNRARFLERCLEVHIPIALRYGIRIHVSDNASDDETAEVVKVAMEKCCWLTYQRNEQNIGPDKNFEMSLKAVGSDYVWLLGDTYALPEAGVTKVLSILSKQTGLDAIVVNAKSRVRDVPSRIYTDPVSLLGDLGWHMTLLSGLIYNRLLIQGGMFIRYQNTNFIQHGVIFEYLASKPGVNVLWLQEVDVSMIELDGLKKASWEAEAIDIWLYRWPCFILSLPPIYPLTIKLKTISDHNRKSYVFGFEMLYYFKGHLFETMKALIRVLPFRCFAPMNCMFFVRLVFVFITPRCIYGYLKELHKRLKSCYALSRFQ